MIRINLVPKDILDKELQRQRSVMLGIAVGFVLLIFAGISFKHYYKSVQLARTLQEQEEKLKKLEKIVRQVEELERQARAVRARLNVMKDLIKARPLYPTFMTEVLKTLPKGVWLIRMETSGSSRNMQVQMQSRAITPEDVSDWVRTLEDSPTFASPSIGNLSVQDTRELGFTMSTQYNYSGSEK